MSDEELSASYLAFNVYVNSERERINAKILSNEEMMIVYAMCHEYWSKERQWGLIHRLIELF